MFARRPDTGEAVWFYQTSPHDLFDHDGVNELVLADLRLDDRIRKIAMRADRSGLLYVMDRTNGEVLSAAPFGYVNSNRGVDMNTGRLIPVEEKTPRQGVVVRDICPAAPGMKDWQPTSFSPRTGLLYIPHQNLCEDIEAMATSYIAGTPFVGASVVYKAGPGGYRGAVTAWDPTAAKAAWVIKEKFPVWSGTVVTAGDVLFYGTMDGWFKAVDAKTGELLWQFKCGSGIIGQPVVYKGPDGHEFVAVLSGVGGWAGAIVSNDLDPRDATAGNGFGGALADLKAATTRGGHALRLLAGRQPVKRVLLGSTGRWSRRWRWPPVRPSLARPPLRVCADPNNLPFSNRAGDGLREPDCRTARRRSPCAARVHTGGRSGAGSCATRWAAGACDVIIGVPHDFEPAARRGLTTDRATCLSSRRDRGLASSRSTIRACAQLRIGVQMIGDDFTNTPSRPRAGESWHHAQRGRLLGLRRLLIAEPTVGDRLGGRSWRGGRGRGLGTRRRILRARQRGRARADDGVAAARLAVAALRVRHLHGRAARRLGAARRAGRLSRSPPSRRERHSR